MSWLSLSTTSLLLAVARFICMYAGLGFFLDFWYCLMVPEAEYVERWRFSEVGFSANLEAYDSN